MGMAGWLADDSGGNSCPPEAAEAMAGRLLLLLVKLQRQPPAFVIIIAPPSSTTTGGGRQGRGDWLAGWLSCPFFSRASCTAPMLLFCCSSASREEGRGGKYGRRVECGGRSCGMRTAGDLMLAAGADGGGMRGKGGVGERKCWGGVGRQQRRSRRRSIGGGGEEEKSERWRRSEAGNRPSFFSFTIHKGSRAPRRRPVQSVISRCPLLFAVNFAVRRCRPQSPMAK
jgi:hypothetical protein